MEKSFVCCRTQRFATKVTHNPAISCSEDSQVAVCTEDGVHVLTIQCDQIYASDNVVLHTSKIAPSNKVKTFDVDVPRLNLERVLTKLDNHQLMFDRTISPLVQSNQVLTGFRVAAWSPRGGDTLGRCVIASLSCDHRLCINKLQQDGQAWNKVVELSDLFYNYVKEEDFHMVEDRIAQSAVEHGELMEKMKWRTYCLAAVAVVWSPVFTVFSKQQKVDHQKASPVDTCNKFAMLAVAMKSGHVVLWKVSFPVTPESVHIETVLDAGSNVPTALCWARLDGDTAVLAVASLNGQLKLFRITTRQTGNPVRRRTMDHDRKLTREQGKEETVQPDMPVTKKRRKTPVKKTRQESHDVDPEQAVDVHDEDLGVEDQEKTSGPHHGGSRDQFHVTEVDPLWAECDKSVIRNLCWSTENNLLIASKGPFLLTFHIVVNTDSSHAPAVCPTVKAHPPLLIGDKLGISALWLDRSKLFVSHIIGSVRCLNIEPDGTLTLDGVDIHHEALETTKHVDAVACQSRGMCGSPGGVYLYLLESPSGNYCHLTIIQPLKLTLVLRTDTDVASMLLKQNESLGECVDGLTHVKYLLARKEPLPGSLVQLIKERSAWSKLSICKLKLLRFLLQVTKLSTSESEVTQEDVLEVEKLIMKSHLETVLWKLLRKEIQPTSDEEKKSLMLACDWLHSCHGNCHDMQLTQKVMTLLKQEHDVMDTKEKCEICQADVAFTSFRRELCPNGHLFARCCQTLLLSRSIPYRTCCCCDAIAVGQQVTGSSWFEDVKTNRCTLCDGLLL